MPKKIRLKISSGQARGETKLEQLKKEDSLKIFMANVPVGFNGLKQMSIPCRQRVCYMTYGRYQPCHKGHLSLFNNMCQLSNQEKREWEERGGSSSAGPPNVYVFVSHTGGPDYDIGMEKYKENPLDSGDKRNLIYEQVGGSDDLITIIDCATYPSLNGPTGAIAALQTCYDKVIVVLGEDRQTGSLADVIKSKVGDDNLVHGGKLDGKDRPASGTNTRRMTWDNKVDGKKLTAKSFDQKAQDKLLFVELVMGGVGQGYQYDGDALGPAILPFPPNISQARLDDLFYKIKFSQPLIGEDGSIDKDKEKLYRGFVSRALALGKQAEDASEPTNKKAAGIAARVEFFTNETCDATTTIPWEKKKKNNKGGKRTKKRKNKRKNKRRTKRKNKRRTKRKNKRKNKRKTKRKNKRKTK